MSASIYGNVGGVSRKAKELWVNVNGTTRKLKSAYANVNGVTRKIYAGYDCKGRNGTWVHLHEDGSGYVDITPNDSGDVNQHFAIFYLYFDTPFNWQDSTEFLRFTVTQYDSQYDSGNQFWFYYHKLGFSADNWELVEGNVDSYIYNKGVQKFVLFHGSGISNISAIKVEYTLDLNSARGQPYLRFSWEAGSMYVNGKQISRIELI